MNPIPTTTWAAIRDASIEFTGSPKPKRPASVKSAAPTPTSVWVFSPALRWRISRSNPMIEDRTNATASSPNSCAPPIAAPPMLLRLGYPPRPAVTQAERRPSCGSRTQQARDDVDRQRDDGDAEHIGQQRVAKEAHADPSGCRLGVGDLERHADGERDVGEVGVRRTMPIVEIEPTTIEVVEVRIPESEHGVHGEPRGGHRQDRHGD